VAHGELALARLPLPHLGLDPDVAHDRADQRTTRSGSSGCAARDSIATKADSSTAAAASMTHVELLVRAADPEAGVEFLTDALLG
jgi:hypothetical protein